jgi:uncharacterized protein (UPF0297 family)
MKWLSKSLLVLSSEQRQSINMIMGYFYSQNTCYWVKFIFIRAHVTPLKRDILKSCVHFMVNFAEKLSEEI